MKAVVAIFWILTLVVAYGVGLLTTARDDSGWVTPGSFSEALEEDDPVARSSRLGSFLREFGPDDLPGVLEVLDEKAVVGVTEDELELLMLAWARFDAPGAFDWAIRQKRPGWPTLAPKAAMYAWGFHEAAGARMALEEIETSGSNRALRSAFVSGWIQSRDIQGVTDYLISLPRSDQRQAWMNWLVKELLEDGVDAVIGWADAVPEHAPGNFKQIAFRVAASAVTSADPERVVAWYEASRGSDYVLRSGALRVIARRWGEYHDAPALFEWLIAVPAGPGRDAAVKAGFSSWLRAARSEAEAWLREAPRTRALDPALEHAAKLKMTGAYRESAEWALRISQPELRRTLLNQLGQRWSRREPESIADWMAEAELSEEDREALLTPPPARVGREVSGAGRKALPMPVRRREQRRAAQRAARARDEADPNSPLAE
jgi:hypothetical protein